MALFLEVFRCSRCGARSRRVCDEETAGEQLCDACSVELTAKAAAAHDLRTWAHAQDR